MELRKGDERGHAQHGWLDSFHSFSFADYHDPRHMGFGALRVINEDRVQPARGFGTHSHRDMEIISYVLDGGLAHKDSMGNGSVIRPGDVQRMSAGTGVAHSEYNASERDPVHFLQIWIEPNVRGIKPSYEEKRFEPAQKRGQLRLIASPDGRDGSVTIHQDAVPVRDAARRRRGSRAHAAARTAHLHPRGSRRAQRQRPGPRGGRCAEAIRQRRGAPGKRPRRRSAALRPGVIPAPLHRKTT
jgi:redox-sensitive bicupin YhaK (pirin superfamily)